MVPFHDWSATVSRLQSEYGETILLFTTRSQGVPDTDLTDLGRIKGWLKTTARQCFGESDCLRYLKNSMKAFCEYHDFEADQNVTKNYIFLLVKWFSNK